MDIEKIIIRSAISKKQNAIDLSLFDLDHFNNYTHKKVAMLIRKNINSGKEIDLVSLKMDSEIEDWYWLDLLQTESTINFQKCLRTLEKASIQDQIQLVAKDIAKIVKKDYDINDLTERLNDLANKLLSPIQTGKQVKDYAQRGYKENFKNSISITLGLSDFDKKVFLLDGSFVIIAADPGVGKSIFTTQLAENNPDKSLIFSLEMPTKKIYSRMLCGIAGVSTLKLVKNDLTLEESERLRIADEKLKNCNLEIVDAPLKIDELVMEAKKRSLKKRISLVVVDYIQLIGTKKNKSKTEAIEEVSRKLKLLANELGCVVVGISNLSRDVQKQDRDPMLSDLKGSSGLEYDADMVMFLQNNGGKYDSETTIKFLIKKNRDFQPGEFNLKLDKKSFKFKNMPVSYFAETKKF